MFGADNVAAAMVGRLVHHAEVIALKGDSYRLKDRDLGRVPAATTDGVHGQEMAKACQWWNDSGESPPVAVRSSQEIAGFFNGLELIEPGVVPVPLRPPDPPPDRPTHRGQHLRRGRPQTLDTTALPTARGQHARRVLLRRTDDA